VHANIIDLLANATLRFGGIAAKPGRTFSISASGKPVWDSASAVFRPGTRAAEAGGWVRWYGRDGRSYRDIEELLAERGVEVDHVTMYRSVHRFMPLFADAARTAATRRATGGSSTKPLSKSPASCYVYASHTPTAPLRSSSSPGSRSRNLRRGRYEPATKAIGRLRLGAAYTELAQPI